MRTITKLIVGEEARQVYSVGVSSMWGGPTVDRIERYEVYGQMAMVPWYRIHYSNAPYVDEINGAYVLQITVDDK